MKIPMQWIGAYTPISLEPQAYMDRMIMCGDGVEGYENLGAEVENVVVGRVLTCVAHPDSDHLRVTHRGHWRGRAPADRLRRAQRARRASWCPWPRWAPGCPAA